jgi:hypothetical protein
MMTTYEERTLRSWATAHQCTSQFCHYKKGHVPVDKITEEFANEMVAKLDTPFNQWGGAQAVAAAAKRAGQQE